MDGGVIVKRQLDCGFWEDHYVYDVLGNVIVHTRPSQCDGGNVPNGQNGAKTTK